MRETAVRALVDRALAYGEEIAAFSAALVAVPTENPPGVAYLACVRLIAAKLAELDLEPTVVEVPGPAGDPYPRACVLASHGTGGPVVTFHGHYDVVPAASPAQFAPRVDDGRLYGRGSADMKGGLAAMIYAVRALKDCGTPLAGRVGLTVVPDEETGGVRGSGYLAERGLLGRDGIGMLTPEPTGGVVWHACRGALTLRVTVRGRHAHVGQQYQGVNAFEGMLDVAGALRQLKADVERRATAFRLDTEPDPEAARRSILMLGGRCEGGTSFNAVPAACSFTVERRINPEEDLREEKARLFELFERLRAGGIDLDVEILQEAPAAGVPEDHPVARALAESVRTVTGSSPTFEMCPGLLEIRWYAQRGIPAFAYGPGLLTVSHGPEEYIELTKLPEAAAIYALTAARILAP